MHSGADHQPHNLVPCGVELDLVDAAAVAVEVPELRRKVVGEPRPIRDFRAAQPITERLQIGLGPARAESRHGLLKRGVGRIEIPADKWSRLVGNFVS